MNEYTEILARKVQKDFKANSILIKVYIHLGYYPKSKISRIEELIEKRTIFFKNSNFKKLKVVHVAKLYLGQLDRLGEWARKKNSFNQKGEELFFTVRECNGKIKISGKAHPPLPKGIKRNIETFKSYDKKLYNSITRAYTTIWELVDKNNWNYYVTLTVDGEKYGRKQLKPLMKAFGKWLNNYNTSRNAGIKYLLIPEFERGGWHLHGLLAGDIPPKDLSLFDPKKHRKLAKKGYLNWTAYNNKFGFCTLSKVQSKDGVSAWYAAKDVRNKPKAQSRKKGSRLYYCSHNFKRSEELSRGKNLFPTIVFDYENEWVKIKRINIT